jgi:hypothetical protein
LVLRGIKGQKAGSKLHNFQLHNIYFSTNIISMIKSRGMRWAGHVARTGEMRNAYIMLIGKSEGKRALVRPRRRWRTILTDLGGVVVGRVWIGFFWLRAGTFGRLL